MLAAVLTAPPISLQQDAKSPALAFSCRASANARSSDRLHCSNATDQLLAVVPTFPLWVPCHLHLLRLATLSGRPFHSNLPGLASRLAQRPILAPILSCLQLDELNGTPRLNQHHHESGFPRSLITWRE
ncbi:hypothetical protein IAQ61_006152 [Plenodomus lingam]|uniref:uncharacterized protein n=1 Tax=Leptosphaeria maculans TaxID=5022 RepID=UPI003333A65E|nr:hypothetical protein IAQ61_006152 [Plenodomus lingam]